MKEHPWWDGLSKEESEELANCLKILSDKIGKDPEEAIEDLSNSNEPLFDSFAQEFRMWELLAKASRAIEAKEKKPSENLPV